MEQTDSTPGPLDGIAEQRNKTVRLVDQDEIATLFDSLNDADVWALLQELENTTLSAQELAERCDLPRSTTYRKVKYLAEVGLLAESKRVTMESKHTTVYRRCIDEMEVLITDDGFALRLAECEDPDLS